MATVTPNESSTIDSTNGQRKKKRSSPRYTSYEWDKIFALACENKLSEIPADILIHNFDRLQRIAKEFSLVKPSIPLRLSWTDGNPPNYWYYGPTGSGKTSSVLNKFSNEGSEIYWLQNSSDWNGYTSEKIILIDNYSLESHRSESCTIHDILQIGDKYPFSIFVEYSSIRIRPEAVYITSFYSPQQICDLLNLGYDYANAIHRRFNVIECKQSITTIVVSETKSNFNLINWFS